MEMVTMETECPVLESTHAEQTVTPVRLTAQDPGNATI